MPARELSRAMAASLVLSLVPWAVDARAADREPPVAPARFHIDPVTDGALIVATGGFATLSSLILTTGEIRPQRPVDPTQLLGIDRRAVTQSIDPRAVTLSNIGMYSAVAYAVLEPLWVGVRGDVHTALVDASLYAETIAFTVALTQIAKFAVRRPRPRAYVEQARLDAQFGGSEASPSVSDTDASLSFYSGHASTVAAIGGAATYLAFARSPQTWRPWVTLGTSTLLTAFVGYERVRAGEHFPTDVIGGALAGAAIGVIVPHLHRDERRAALAFGCVPVPSGGTLVVHGRF